MACSILTRRALSFACALMFSVQFLFSQTITYQNPTEFFVCGSAPFEITVSNPTGSEIQNVSVLVHFTTSSGNGCGLAYAVGTVSGASEGDVSDPTLPQFQLGNMAAGSSQTFTFQVEAPCSAVACIDNAALFFNEITLNWNDLTTTVTTDPYVVETALLVITNLSNAVMSGTRGDILQRKITIRNTRPAALQGFLFSDVHQPGISISSAQGTDISSGNTFQIALGGSDFNSIGDGDGLFEFNETIVITENILITDCGVDILSAASKITAGWGCGGEICQEVSVNAVVKIKPYNKIPNLVWEPITTVPECFCGPGPHQQGMKIKNTGQGVATQITLDVWHGAAEIDRASIKADSAGSAIAVKVVPTFTAEVPAPCVGLDSATTAFFVTIPAIAPGATVTVYWDVYFCRQTCQQPGVNWLYRYSYFKECPPDPFIQQNQYISVSKTGKWMQMALSPSGSGVMQDDSLVTINYQITYDSLTLLDDELIVEFSLPCGLNWEDDNELLLNGKAPTDVTLMPQGEFFIVKATYQLPLSANTAMLSFDAIWNCEDLCFDDQICKDSLLTSCMAVDTCSIPFTPQVVLSVKTTLLKCPGFPESCNMQACSELILAHDCPVDSICIEQPPGYVSYQFDAYRLNLGLPDNNNDRFPDGPGTPNLNLIRRDRAMTGDTLRAAWRGVVVNDLPANFPFGNIQMRFTADHLLPDNLVALLKDDTGVRQAGTRLRIFDSSSGAYYQCNNLTPLVSGDGSIRYTYDLSAAVLGGCVPANFTFNNGDSILFEADYRIQYNIKRDPAPDPDPLMGRLYLTPALVVFDSDTTAYDPLNCGCGSRVFEVTGYEHAILPGLFALPPCGPSGFVGGSLFRLELHQGNFFPYEHRNLLTLLNSQMTFPASVQLLQTRLTFLRFQDGANILSNQMLTPTFANGVHTFNMAQFQNPPLDEGFSALFQYAFQNDCKNTGSLPLKLTSHLDFVPGIPTPTDPFELSVQSNALRSLIPNLAVSAPLNDLVSFNNQLVYDFDFINFPTVVGSLTSGAAPNTWMYVTSPTGQVTNFQLINQETGATIPSVNGVFQLGSYPVDTIPFRLIGTNNSCEMENLQLHFGWNCTPFNSTVQTPCNRQVQPLTILSPPGELDLIVTSPPGCSDLCDTIPYHTIEIFNAELGALYDLTLTALLPPGMTVLPGSSQVEYPTGSGNFVPIGDPAVPVSGTAVWNLTSLVANITGGLPGVSAAPNNSLKLRFLGENTCDFVANAYAVFIAAAKQNCGIASNSVAKPGDPLCIEGISQPYSASIGVDAEPGFTCNDEATFEVTLTASQALPLGACAIVTLPPGVAYVPGSCSSACQPNFNCNPTQVGNTLTWQLPAGVAPNQIVCFSFKTSGWSGLGCETGVVLVRTANETQALCVATGDSCSTKVSTGALIVPFEIQRPAFSLENFMVNAAQSGAADQINYSIDIVNNGAQNEPPITVQFYLDTDGNGTGDQLVHTENLVEIIANGQSVTSSGSFEIPGGNLCHLIAVIDPDAQCACSGDVAQVIFPIEYQTEQNLVVCSGETAAIGVTGMPGFSYQWTPAGCILDQNAAMTSFSCVNDTGEPLTYNFTLAEAGGGCEIKNLIDVTLQPQPGILFAETPICSGQTANLAVTNGESFNWTGPGVVPNLQVQSVTPVATSNYAVTVTDAEGCTGTDAVTIVVNPVPSVDAGKDTTFCPGQMAKLNAVTVPGYSYAWSPAAIGGLPALSNPGIANPVILTGQNTTFTLTVTDANGCKNSDVVVVSFSDSLELTVSPDVTICTGSSTTLMAFGADFYQWSPGGNCQDPACSSIVVSPAATTTYTVVGSTVDDCLDTAFVTVTVVTDVIVTNGPPVEICEGETTVLFGEIVSQPGVYCDTVTLAGGCDSVHCVELLVKNAIDTTFFEDAICQGQSVDFQGETFTEPGLHCVTFPGGNGCDSTLCLNLTVFDTALFELIVPDTVSPGDSVLFSIEPGTFDSILWFGGNITGLCTNSPVCLDSLTESTEYFVTVVDANGCFSTVSQAVTVMLQCEPEKAELPNVFSPNNDGVNDVFTIVSPGAESVLNMRIWNRWGEKVYDGPGPWDGTQNGKPAGSDVYIYLIKVGCPVSVETEERVLKGDVTLLR
jgi:gliding motility-associated-like protein